MNQDEKKFKARSLTVLQKQQVLNQIKNEIVQKQLKDEAFRKRYNISDKVEVGPDKQIITSKKDDLIEIMQKHHIYNNFFKEKELDEICEEINNELQDNKLVKDEEKKAIRQKQKDYDTSLS